MSHVRVETNCGVHRVPSLALNDDGAFPHVAAASALEFSQGAVAQVGQADAGRVPVRAANGAVAASGAALLPKRASQLFGHRRVDWDAEPLDGTAAAKDVDLDDERIGGLTHSDHLRPKAHRGV